MPRSPRRLFVTALLAVAVSALPSLALGNHSWGGYHWARTANPFTVKLGDNVSGDWDRMLNTASSDWTESVVLNTEIVGGGTTGSTCQPTLGRVEVCSANYGNTGWLGLAQIWTYLGSKHIAQGLVKNNDYYFGSSSSYTYNNSAEMQHVICQEVGHTLGLGHQSESGVSLDTCMDYHHNISSSDLRSTYPNDGDYHQLRCIYDPTAKRTRLTSDGHSCRGTGHLDSTNSATGGANGSGSFGGSSADASSWGRLVATSGGGAASTFIRELGDGRAIVTFVIWARS